MSLNHQKKKRYYLKLYIYPIESFNLTNIKLSESYIKGDYYLEIFHHLIHYC